MSMPRLAGSNHRPFQNVERGEQGGRSVPLIIVRLSCGQAGPQRKNQLRALQGLQIHKTSIPFASPNPLSDREPLVRQSGWKSGTRTLANCSLLRQFHPMIAHSSKGNF